MPTLPDILDILTIRRGGLLLLLTLSAACSTGRPSRPQTERRDPYLILAAELETSNTTNVYDAVRKLRPHWFTRDTQTRGARTSGSAEQRILVYLDDQQIGNSAILRRFSINMPARVRYMSPTEAQVRYGQLNGLRPAIVIESAKP